MCARVHRTICRRTIALANISRPGRVQQIPAAFELKDLWNLKLTGYCAFENWRLNCPVIQVFRRGVTDHTILVGGIVMTRSCEIHVPAVSVWIRKYKRITASFVNTTGHIELLIILSISLNQRRIAHLFPMKQIIRQSSANALDMTTFCTTDRRVEHHPLAIWSFEGRPCPRGKIIPSRTSGCFNSSSVVIPISKVLGCSVPD